MSLHDSLTVFASLLFIVIAVSPSPEQSEGEVWQSPSFPLLQRGKIPLNPPLEKGVYGGFEIASATPRNRYRSSQ